MDDARRMELLDLIDSEARAKGASDSDINRIKKLFEQNFGWSFSNPHAAIDDENIKRLVAFELKR